MPSAHYNMLSCISVGQTADVSLSSAVIILFSFSSNSNDRRRASRAKSTFSIVVSRTASAQVVKQQSAPLLVDTSIVLHGDPGDALQPHCQRNIALGSVAAVKTPTRAGR